MTTGIYKIRNINNDHSPTAGSPLGVKQSAETMVGNYQEFTVPQIYQAVGEEITHRWEALGQMDSKVHWSYGAEADALIPEFPAMLVYKAIALKAGRTSQTIRKAYYTFKRFDNAIREKYNLCPYTIFQHAATQKDPIKVLEHYVAHRSVDEIETVFPLIENEELEKEFMSYNYPRIFYGIVRETYGLEPFLKARVNECLKEIQQIIEEANK